MRVRVLAPADAAAYRLVRLRALAESPPAFGSLPQDEPDLARTAARLDESDDRCFFGAFQGERLVGIIRLSRYEAANEKHRAYLGGLFVLPDFRAAGRWCVRPWTGRRIYAESAGSTFRSSFSRKLPSVFTGRSDSSFTARS